MVKIKGQYLQGAFVWLIVLVLLGFAGFNEWKGAATEKFQSTDGTIVKSAVELELMNFGRYAAEVAYDYKVNGQSFTGHVIGYSTMSYRYKSYAESDLYPYPVGKKVAVYYNPANPSEAVLKKHAQNLIPLYGTAAIFAVFASVLWFLKLPKTDYDYVPRKYLPDWLYEKIKYE